MLPALSRTPPPDPFAADTKNPNKAAASTTAATLRRADITATLLGPLPIRTAFRNASPPTRPIHQKRSDAVHLVTKKQLRDWSAKLPALWDLLRRASHPGPSSARSSQTRSRSGTPVDRQALRVAVGRREGVALDAPHAAVTARLVWPRASGRDLRRLDPPVQRRVIVDQPLGQLDPTWAQHLLADPGQQQPPRHPTQGQIRARRADVR